MIHFLELHFVELVTTNQHHLSDAGNHPVALPKTPSPFLHTY